MDRVWLDHTNQQNDDDTGGGSGKQSDKPKVSSRPLTPKLFGALFGEKQGKES